MDPNTTLTGPQIVCIRKRLVLSQAALAKKIGSSQAALSRRETSNEPHTGSEIMLIALLAKEGSVEIPSHNDASAQLAKWAEEAVA